MKTKTDLYTKIVLTVIAIFLGVIVFKDVSFVTKVQANELDLSALKIENASDAEGTTFFIYENSKLDQPFTKYNNSECEIHCENIPTHIITSKKVPNYSRLKITKVK